MFINLTIRDGRKNKHGGQGGRFWAASLVSRLDCLFFLGYSLRLDSVDRLHELRASVWCWVCQDYDPESVAFPPKDAHTVGCIWLCRLKECLLEKLRRNVVVYDLRLGVPAHCDVAEADDVSVKMVHSVSFLKKQMVFRTKHTARPLAGRRCPTIIQTFLSIVRDIRAFCAMICGYSRGFVVQRPRVRMVRTVHRPR